MKRTLFGIGVIIFGLVLMLASLEIGSASELLKAWWPVFVIGLGLIMLIDRRRGDWWPYIVLFVGAVVLLETTGVVGDVNLWKAFWPGLIVIGGLWLVVQTKSTGPAASSKSSDKITAIMSGNDSKNSSDDYQGSVLTAIMGGINLDLTKATIKKEAAINVSIVMGGVELRVPEGVVVKPRATSIAGSIEDKTVPSKAKGAPVIYIDGSVLMGGVEVRN